MRALFVEQRLKFDGMKDEYPHRELSAAIIGAAMNVLNGLRPGLDEKIYENSLALELIAQGHQVEQQRRFPVHYRDHLVGTLIPDILVDEKVIVVRRSWKHLPMTTLPRCSVTLRSAS
jgi:GxxExxY protein